MDASAKSKDVVDQLYSQWGIIRNTAGLPEEIVYRVDRLTRRLQAISGKVYLKTVKAGQMLSNCERLTCKVTSRLASPDDRTYWLLTSLENQFDELDKRTYAFRIKAG